MRSAVQGRACCPTSIAVGVSLAGRDVGKASRECRGCLAGEALKEPGEVRQFTKAECLGDLCCRAMFAQLTLCLQRDGLVDQALWLVLSDGLARSSERSRRTSDEVCTVLHRSWGRYLREKAFKILVDQVEVRFVVAWDSAQAEERDEKVSDRVQAAKR